MKKMTKLASIYVALAVALGAATTGFAQGLSASGTVSGVSDGSDFLYTITLNNIGTTAIGAIWYGWVPGEFYLPGVPSNANVSNPTGWSGNVPFGLPSLQYVADSAGDFLQPGDSTTFQYTASFTPSQLMSSGLAGYSYVYSVNDTAEINSESLADAAFVIVPAVAAPVPEPSPMALAVIGFSALVFIGMRKSRKLAFVLKN